MYDLHAWSRNPTNNIKFKNCLLEATIAVKNINEYNGYDSADVWSFDNDVARNIIVFGVDISSLSHADNRKNNFLALGEDPNFWIGGSFSSLEKKFSINFSKANTKFCLNLHYNSDNSYLLVNRKEILSFKPTVKMLTFKFNFALEAYLMDLVVLNLDKYL